ncbi:MAG: serine--tRNA ligase [Bacteroidetes bacterium]|nr:MAG: serine--tRNA ligase [Bacteroidota bacterium]
MLELALFRTQKERIVEGLRKRNFSEEDLKIVDQIIELDEVRRTTQVELDNNLAESKKLSKHIGQLMQSGKREEGQALRERVLAMKERAKALETRLDETTQQLEELLLQVPNLPHPSVPAGSTEADNRIHKDWPQPLPELPEQALPHWELAERFKIFSLETGAKLTGSGFPLFWRNGARLVRGLIQFFLDEGDRAGYQEVLPPLLVNADTAKATGQLPDKEGQMYHIEKDGLYLIPTAEVPITNIYRDTIVSPEDLPLKLMGYTPCFRREAGSYGAHVRGLNRVHQFDKVEIVQIAHPDLSYQALDEMVAHVEGLLQKLELPYRIVQLCGGDLGFTAALTYDFEVYSAAQKRWLEVSSVSNFETYQSNRLKVRFKEDGKMRLAHTLNGSALALARIVAALLENNQQPEGIRLPAALHPYVGMETVEA